MGLMHVILSCSAELSMKKVFIPWGQDFSTEFHNQSSFTLSTLALVFADVST